MVSLLSGSRRLIRYMTATGGWEVRVSYIVTVFNKARYLPFVVEGLRRQEGEFERELIFIDDGSTDGSAALIRELTSDLSDVTVVEQPNAGPSVATNVGFGLATGDFIKPVDGDDVLYPWTTQALLDAQAQTGCKISYAHFERAGLYDSDLSGHPGDIFKRLRRTPGQTITHPDLLWGVMVGCLMTPSSWLAETGVVRATTGCCESVFTQDYGLNIKLAQLGPIAELHESIFMAPIAREGRLSENPRQERHDEAMILARYIEETTGLDAEFRQRVFVLALKKLFHAQQRRGVPKWTSVPYWNLRFARMRLLKPDPARIEAGCRRLRREAKIIVPGRVSETGQM